MEPRNSLPHLQVPSTCPRPKPHQSSPCPPPPSHCLKNCLNIILPSTPVSIKWPTSLMFPHQKPCIHLSPIHSTRPAYLILLNLTTRIILGEQYRSLSSLLCSFLHSSDTSTLLDPMSPSAPYFQTS